MSDSNQIRDFTFNGDNKQTEIKVGNQTIGRYFYDGEGKRVKKVTNLEETVFVYDGIGKLIAEYSTDISQTPQTKYLTEDHLGTPRIITDATGQITARRDFLPFGEDLFAGVGSRNSAQKYGSNTDDIRQKFTGYQKDKETSLDFAEARMYENRFGRFTAVDPLLASGKSANPQTFNRYVYTSNNPIIRVDRNGKIWIRSKTKDKNGLYTYRDETGKNLEKYLSSGGYERVKFNGKYSDIIVNGNPVYRMFAKGDGVELTQKPKENTGGLNEGARALVNDLGARATPLLKVMTILSAPVAVAAIPVTGPAAIAAIGAPVAGTTGAVVTGAVLSTQSGSDSKGNSSPTPTPTPSPTPENCNCTLWRGVAFARPGEPGYDAYQNALQGTVIPRGGHSDPELHAAGDTNSIFTSWTADPWVAQDKAGSGGVFLTHEFNEDQLIQTTLIEDEQEFLVVGPVTGARHTIVP